VAALAWNSAITALVKQIFWDRGPDRFALHLRHHRDRPRGHRDGESRQTGGAHGPAEGLADL